MLNIISNEVFKPKWLVTGQTKVFRNLISGLEKVGYPYVLNKKHEYCDRLWIYNDRKAVAHLKNIDVKKIHTLVGPCFLPRELKEETRVNPNLKSCVVLQPSAWSKDFLTEYAGDCGPIDCWPVGIDAESFVPSTALKEYVLIYFKQRFRFELALAAAALKKKNIAYKIIEYGKYNEAEYKTLLDKARYIVWIGRQESQGIAMGEALARDIPMLVWEVSCLGHWQPSTAKEAELFTDEELAFAGAKVATYFDETCGKITRRAEDVTEGIDFMEKNLGAFRPRDYILKNLSLEGQSRALINLFDKHWPGGDRAEKKETSDWKPRLPMEFAAEVFYRIKKRKIF